MQRDTDSADQAARLALLLWSLIGAFLGALLGAFLVPTRGWPALPSVMGFAAAGAGLVYAFGSGIAKREIMAPPGPYPTMAR